MRERLADTRFLLATGWRIDRRLTVALIATLLVVSVGQTIRALWFKFVIDAVVDQQLRSAVIWAIVLAGSDALRSWGRVHSEMARMDLHDRALIHFQRESMALAGNVPTLEHHEATDHIDRLSVFRNSFRPLSTALGAVVEAAMTLIRGVFTVVLMALVHPALVLLPVFALPSLWAARRAEKVTHDAALAEAADARRNEHLWSVSTTPGPAKEIRVLGAGPMLRQAEHSSWDAVTRTRRKATLVAGLWNTTGWLSFGVAYVAAIVGVALLAVDGGASAGDVILVVALAGQVNWQVAGAASLVGTLTQGMQAVALFRWLSKFEADRRLAGPGAPPPARLTQGIELRGVSFTYPGTDVVALEDVDLELPTGTVVALVGENGAGKTTLTKLLLGLYTPSRGTITVDGQPLPSLDLDAWRQASAAAFQDFVRFELCAGEVVGIGDLSHLRDAEAISSALARSGATSIVRELPSGLETRVGTLFGAPVDLSAGQWQTLALGRAMMRPLPLLVVLDEPTAALDAHAERELFEHYVAGARAAASAAGSVTVLVSHRFSTVRMADLIVVLDGGHIVEVGDHKRLAAAGGLYAELYELQARSYK